MTPTLSMALLFVRNISVLHAEPDTGEAGEPLSERLGDRNRTVASPGAADSDRQVRLPLVDVLRNEELQEVEGVVQEFMRGARFVQVAYDFGVTSRMRAQRRDEMRIRQEPHVEQQIRVHRDTVLETE